MKSVFKTSIKPLKAANMNKEEQSQLSDAIKASWKTIAPFWPLKNLIAVNPLQGFEGLPFEEALEQGSAYFQQLLPKKMEAVNRESIKWLQAFFDDGQATIKMPLRANGFYAAYKELVIFDKSIGFDKNTKKWLKSLPESPEAAIAECLLKLSIAKEERAEFLTLILTTLPGWAAHIKYRTDWCEAEPQHPHAVTEADYLAVRLIITCLLWPDAKELIKWHEKAKEKAKSVKNIVSNIEKSEENYRAPLLKELMEQAKYLKTNPKTPDAQLVFCIDVRSEPFRKSLESTGSYETYGFAGFFGVPIRVEDETTGESYASCPVLLQPKHNIKESPCSTDCKSDKAGYERISAGKRFYQSLKYNFTTPFALVETLGLASGVWTAMRSFAPNLAEKLKIAASNALRKPVSKDVSLDNITLEQQCGYAEGVLNAIGLTSNFAPLIVFCGHGSTTQNNAYATALDCGACGGRHGASNAKVLAKIMNNPKVREYLATKDIDIPLGTLFIASEHNTTTDEVEIYADLVNDLSYLGKIVSLKEDFEVAKEANSQWRSAQMGVSGGSKETLTRSKDWAQVRAEWGLAKNAAFIIAPRDLTRNINLQGRSFLHSYDYKQDPNGASLTAILTAPMVVAEWINTQYLFSTLDNIAYGGGSKVTKNITGKIGIMQGNASDLMHGLPLQSVYSSDTDSYHEAQRLMTVVYAPRKKIETIIAEQEVLKKLFGNGWVQLACIEPEDNKVYMLNRKLQWQKAG